MHGKVDSTNAFQDQQMYKKSSERGYLTIIRDDKAVVATIRNEQYKSELQRKVTVLQRLLNERIATTMQLAMYI